MYVAFSCGSEKHDFKNTDVSYHAVGKDKNIVVILTLRKHVKMYSYNSNIFFWFLDGVVAVIMF